MNKSKIKKQRQDRKQRVRYTTKGTSQRPRLHVFRSNRYIYAQIIDDSLGKTLVAASENQLEKTKTATKTEKATAIGKLLAEKAKKAKVTKVVFDRGYYKYHGRVKAVAEAARQNGLEF
jgi:large subunit ribosomal protein L18